jgi:hypothetical protein
MFILMNYRNVRINIYYTVRNPQKGHISIHNHNETEYLHKVYFVRKKRKKGRHFVIGEEWETFWL